MPGFSSECVTGNHAACAEPRGSCRCTCHPETQELMRRGPMQGSKRGGIRRRGKTADAPMIIPQPGRDIIMQPETELANTCPKCGARARPTDTFCRRDGAKLLMGKQCLGCGSPAEPDDVFCWACGLKVGDKPPEPVPEVEPTPREDTITRLQRQAREQGLLRETTVP